MRCSCSKNVIDKSFFSKWTVRWIRESLLWKIIYIYIYQDTDCLSSPYVKNASNNIHKDYVVVPIYKTNENIFSRKDHLPLLLLKNQD